MYLIDSNILIYALQGRFDLDFKNVDCFAISTVSRLEILVGSKKHNLSVSYLESFLDRFKNFDMDRAIVREAVGIHSVAVKKLKFKDLVIAATAKLENLTLLTADSDFKNLPGLKVKMLNLAL